MILSGEKSVAPSTFEVGPVRVRGDLILSPMEGYSDQPYRSLCRELGSAMSYTEFINAIDINQNLPRIEKKLKFAPDERPVVFQIFDNDPVRLLEAALRLQERGPDIIDINMGCSVRKVSGRGAGAGLLRTPIKVARIFRTLSHHLEVPVTAKIRLGWDDGSLNYKLISRIVEENGGSLIAVHGRTKVQGYGGRAVNSNIVGQRSRIGGAAGVGDFYRGSIGTCSSWSEAPLAARSYTTVAA